MIEAQRSPFIMKLDLTVVIQMALHDYPFVLSMTLIAIWSLLPKYSILYANCRNFNITVCLMVAGVSPNTKGNNIKDLFASISSI